MELLLSPYQLLLDKAQRGQIDPEDIDLQELIDDFRQRLSELSERELFFEAGAFLQAIAGLLKLKALKLLQEDRQEKREKKVRVRLEEVLKAIEPQKDESLDWLWDYSVHAGRPQGRKDAQKRETYRPESIPLHKSFDIEEYRQKLQELGIEDFDMLRDFLYRVPDRIERLRFFMAWL
ncbi:MAG: hypothetical protein ACK42C_00145 [Aquificaceae bacterium]